MVTLDSDCNGVFKITDKDTQVLKVVQSDGTHTLTQTFDLSGLTLGVNGGGTISPESVTFDLNQSGANHRDLVFTVTPAIVGTEIDKFQFFNEDEQQWQDVPQKIDDLDVWSLDESKLVLTVYVVAFMAHPAGTELTASVVLTDGTGINVTVTIEDTT